MRNDSGEKLSSTRRPLPATDWLSNLFGIANIMLSSRSGEEHGIQNSAL